MSLVMDIKFDGELLSENNYVPLRVAAKVFLHMQRAIDRAYLSKENRLHKYAKVGRKNYDDCAIWLGETRPNCRIFDILASKRDHQIIESVKNIFNSAFTKVLESNADVVIPTLLEEARDAQKKLIVYKSQGVLDEEAFLAKRTQLENEFVDRSVAKELAEMSSVVTSPMAGDDSSLCINFYVGNRVRIDLNRSRAKILRKIVGRKMLGDTVSFKGVFRGGDIEQKCGKFDRHSSGKTSMLYFSEKEECQALNRISGEEITIVGCPIFEYDSYDMDAGDIYFLCKE